MSRKLRVGITHGDINGIGCEVILKSFLPSEMTELCTPVLFGSGRIVGFYRKLLNLGDFRYTQIDSAANARDGEFNVVNIAREEVEIKPGEASADAGRWARMSLEAATEALKNGEIDVLVTAPINKNTIHSEEFPFAGHTEYLAERLKGDDEDEASKPLMILYDERIRVALVTTHLPISEVSAAITTEAVVEKLEIFNHALIADFACDRPRIAVLSLNPHAGDGGLLGNEEQDVIIPAIEQAREAGILAFGPFAADGFFGKQQHRNFDGVLAMYHDQGLAPFKGLSVDPGVNFTAGLEFVRTSPDHGTGFDIAGKGVADESSMRQAVYSALDIYRHRDTFRRVSANPLRRQFVARGKDKTVDLTKEE